MNLPKVIVNLIKAQDDFDSVAYANCFSEAATVFDEGKTHRGRTEIQQWIRKANEDFKTIMKPLEYSATEQVLKADISGEFPGSPVVLSYHFEIADEQIRALKITG